MTNDELDPRLTELLDELKPIPERDPKAAARGKNKFLTEAVSLSESQRHSWWTTIFHPKEKFAMNLIASVLVVAGLLFGSGATVVAAQNALPNDVLYQVKLLSEDAHLWLNTEPATEVDLLMQQAQTRAEEMAALNAQGIIPPAALTTRTQDRIQKALQVTSTLDETEVTDTLLQIRDRLQTQDRLLSQLQDGTCADCKPILKQTRDMLHTQLGEVEDGLADPQGFIHRHHNQVGAPTPEATEVPATEQPTEINTESAVDAEEPIATKEPSSCRQESCSPVQDGTGEQNGTTSVGTPQPSLQQNGDNHPTKPGEPPAPKNEPGGQPQPESGGGGRP